MPQTTDLVIALRATYQMQSQKAPIHSMPTITFTDTDEEGLGGLRTLRGYRQNRFVGPSASFINAEVRWMPVKFRVGGQHFGLGLVPFVDAGRVYDRVDFSLRKWRLGSGAGLRIAWNQATILVADYGVSTEDRTFGLVFGHHF
jgi:hemolysin activation/secretion protein